MRVAFFLLLLAPLLAVAQMALPTAPHTEYVQRLNAELPLQSVFTDDDGRSVRLAEFFNDKPVVLALGYYHCPNLCSTVMDGVLETLSRAGLPHDDYRVVEASVDPRETAAFAARRKAAYIAVPRTGGIDMHLLTGTQAAISALAKTAGFHYQYDASLDQYAHPAGFLIVTPSGRISHYFMGVRFDPKDVRLALIDASSGRIGSPVDRLLLMCCNYDPATGRYSLAAMTAVRIVCLSVLALLAGWMLLHRKRGGGER